MGLNKLSIQDKKIFAKYLSLCPHELSVYAFENIYIWKGLFRIYWTVIEDSLCLFFKDKLGCFLYIPPLAKSMKPKVVDGVFGIMDKFNRNKEISRIENVEAKDIPFYQKLGYKCRNKPDDYLCLRESLVRLSGNRFKSKRACFNYFVKHYPYEYLPFSSRYRDNCLKLYDIWMSKRKNTSLDAVYQGMLEDNRNCLKILLGNYKDLGLAGRMVKIDNEVKGFTFGFKLNKDTFCILYEITDLAIKGLAQFIFRRFCCELKDYRYINIMDDSGLNNLKVVKLSYHPIKLIPAYILTRNNNE